MSRPDIPILSWQLKRAHRCKKKALMASQECNDIEMTQDGNGGRCDCNACNDHKTFRPHLAACSGPYSCAPVSQEWDYMVSKVPNRTKEGEPRIVTEVMLAIAVVWMWSEVDRKTIAFHVLRSTFRPSFGLHQIYLFYFISLDSVACVAGVERGRG